MTRIKCRPCLGVFSRERAAVQAEKDGAFRSALPPRRRCAPSPLACGERVWAERVLRGDRRSPQRAENVAWNPRCARIQPLSPQAGRGEEPASALHRVQPLQPLLHDLLQIIARAAEARVAEAEEIALGACAARRPSACARISARVRRSRRSGGRARPSCGSAQITFSTSRFAVAQSKDGPLPDAPHSAGAAARRRISRSPRSWCGGRWRRSRCRDRACSAVS